jgi:hypothetical protein
VAITRSSRSSSPNIEPPGPCCANATSSAAANHGGLSKTPFGRPQDYSFSQF